MRKIFGVIGVLTVGLALAAGPSLRAEPPARLFKVAGLCMKSGERESGFNKVCYYDCIDGEIARTIGSTQLCPLSIQDGGQGGQQSRMPEQRPKPTPTICFAKGEETTSAFKKNCAYDCLGSLRVITIGATQLCPQTIKQ